MNRAINKIMCVAEIVITSIFMPVILCVGGVCEITQMVKRKYELKGKQ